MNAASRKPCDQPCCKCGSADIFRRHLQQGEVANLCGRHRVECLRECILHYCRTCGYLWETEVLEAVPSEPAGPEGPEGPVLEKR